MKKLLIGLLAIGSMSAFANVTQIKCHLEGKASVNGKIVSFSDNSISGYLQGTEVIFDENDENYQHVRIVNLERSQTLTYAVEGYDFRNGRVTITVLTKRNTTPASETVSIFKVPLNQKRFSGASEVYLEKSKESHHVKLTCNL